MSKIPHQSAEQHPLRNAVALAGVMLAAAGGLAEKAPADHDPIRPASPTALTALGHQSLASFGEVIAQQPAGQNAESTTSPTAPGKIEINRPADHGSENGPLPKQVEAIMRRDTVYLSVLGCSGEAIRGAKGKVIGVLTAEHCSLTDQKNERIQGTDGNYYIVQPEPVQAKTGASMNDLSTVATIDRFIVPNTGDDTRDLAIGVAKGQNPSEVLEAYERSTLPKAKLQQLKVGGKLYMAGWPEYQPANKTYSEERQSFAMTILGLGQTKTTEGKDLNVVWAAVPPTKDGAECSYGASGSEGFVMVNGQARAVGTLSVFMDLTGKVPDSPSSPDSIAPALGIGSSKNIAAICGFSYETPNPSEGGMVLRAVRSASEIPGYVSPEQAIATAREQFKDPNYTKTIINGAVEMPNPDSGAEKGGPPTWVNNPALFHDAVHNNTVLAWANPTDPDHLAFAYVEDKNLYEIVIYPNDDATPNLLSSIGTDQYQADPTGQTSGDFIDSNQQVFGSVLPGAPNVNGSGFTLETKDGSIGIVSSKGMK